MHIELKNINKTFGDFKASDDVSFGIEKGKIKILRGNYTKNPQKRRCFVDNHYRGMVAGLACL